MVSIHQILSSRNYHPLTMAKPQTIHDQCVKPHLSYPHNISVKPSFKERARTADIVRQCRLQKYVSDKKSQFPYRCFPRKFPRTFLNQSKLSASILYRLGVFLYHAKLPLLCHIDTANCVNDDIKNNDF